MKNTIIRHLLSYAAILLLAACPIRLVSEYDPDLVKGVDEVQSKVAMVHSKLQDCAVSDSKAYLAKRQNANEIPDPAYIKCLNPSTVYDKKDYSEMQAKLEVLIVSSEAIPKSQSITRQLVNIERSILLYPVPEDVSTGSEAHPPKSVVASGLSSAAVDSKPVTTKSLQQWNSQTELITLADINDSRILFNRMFKSIKTVENARKSGDKSPKE